MTKRSGPAASECDDDMLVLSNAIAVARASERGPFARQSAEVAKICILPFEVATQVTLARLDMDSNRGHVFKGIHI